MVMNELYTVCMNTHSNTHVHGGNSENKHSERMIKMPSHTVFTVGESCQPGASLVFWLSREKRYRQRESKELRTEGSE